MFFGMRPLPGGSPGGLAPQLYESAACALFEQGEVGGSDVGLCLAVDGHAGGDAEPLADSANHFLVSRVPNDSESDRFVISHLRSFVWLGISHRPRLAPTHFRMPLWIPVAILKR